jgi:hypothetical protein
VQGQGQYLNVVQSKGKDPMELSNNDDDDASIDGARLWNDKSL